MEMHSLFKLLSLPWVGLRLRQCSLDCLRSFTYYDTLPFDRLTHCIFPVLLGLAKNNLFQLITVYHA